VLKVECEVKKDEEVDVQTLMQRLRHHVLVNRIRVKQYFADYDPLNSGAITKARFQRGLSYMGLSSLGQHHLTAAQLATICHIYEDPKDPQKVAWTRFTADMESVFTLPNLEYTPSTQVPPSSIYKVPKPGTMDWRFADKPQRDFTEKTLARLAAYVAERRALVRPFLKSLDPQNNGHLSRARFRAGLTVSELHCTEAEMQALESRFGNDVGVDYRAFLDIIEPRPTPEFRFLTRLKELRTTNDKPPLPELYPADSLEALLQKIKTKVLFITQVVCTRCITQE